MPDGDHEDAVELFIKVTKNDPENADALNILGFGYRELGDFDKAFTYYREGSRLGHLGADQ